MSPEELNWALSFAATLLAALAGLIFWFLRRYITSQDESNEGLVKAIESVKKEALALDKIGTEFSRQVEHRLERLDGRTNHWIGKLEALMTQASNVSQAIFKIEMRIESLSEKLQSLEDKMGVAETRLIHINDAASNLVTPLEHLRNEISSSSTIVSNLVPKVREVEADIRTIKIVLGQNATLLRTKK